MRVIVGVRVGVRVGMRVGVRVRMRVEAIPGHFRSQACGEISLHLLLKKTQEAALWQNNKFHFLSTAAVY